MQEELPPDRPAELRDFRQQYISSVLYALARMAVKTGDDSSVVSELKSIAINKDIIIYFRVSAVEVLQDLSLYFDSSAQALYDLINWKVEDSYAQNKNWQVSDRAFRALRELSDKTPEGFFSFLEDFRKRRDDSDSARRTFFFHLPKELRALKELDKHSRPLLKALSQDLKIAP